jgi:hypothetical protein
MMEPSMERIEPVGIFFSYAHEDGALMDDVQPQPRFNALAQRAMVSGLTHMERGRVHDPNLVWHGGALSDCQIAILQVAGTDATTDDSHRNGRSPEEQTAKQRNGTQRITPNGYTRDIGRTRRTSPRYPPISDTIFGYNTSESWGWDVFCTVAARS